MAQTHQKPKKRRGGAGPYRKGAASEHKAKRAYESSGWRVTRSPKSGSPYDLVCVGGGPLRKGWSWVHWVQVKSEGYLRPAEREALIEIATTYGGKPILAWIENGLLKRRSLDGGFIDDLKVPAKQDS